MDFRDSGYETGHGSCVLVQVLVAGICELGNERLDPIKGRKFLDQLSDCQHLEKITTAWTQLNFDMKVWHRNYNAALKISNFIPNCNSNLIQFEKLQFGFIIVIII